jgi:hypothetical protein
MVHFLALVTCFIPPIVPMSDCCMLVFGTEQFGGIHHSSVFPSIPYLSGRPFSSEASYQKSFWDFVVEHPYCME